MSKRPPVLGDTHATLAETLEVLRQRDQLQRRRFLFTAMGGAAALALPALRATACSLIPTETAGPYPGDGTNGGGINALTQSGIVRADIRASFGASGSAIATGTPLTVGLQLSSTTVSCASLAGLAVYIWHCDAQGRY